MTSLAWVLILAALLIAQRVFKGRVMQLPEDISDAFLALVSNEPDKLKAVLNRAGESTTPTIGDKEPTLATDIGKDAPKGAGGLAAAAIKLGKAAKGYVWGATGPNYYDCSGLMYRAAQKVGYKGPRFTTSTVENQKGMIITRNPQYGDMVVWKGSGDPDGHMGVVTGGNDFYSAMNPNDGIGYAKISTFRKDTPIYVRFTG
jgi:cell wall-associated NlpC family hydrolase